MKNKKIVIATIMLLIMTSLIAYATVGTRTAELVYDNIKIVLDGKKLTPTDANGKEVEPYTIDGTTYLPVRAISSALGLDVSWNEETKTVELNTPGAFSNAIKVYDDENVLIEFAGCTAEKPYEWSDTLYYYANFNVKNKTNTELTFQPDALSFNGMSFNSFMGSENVAPQSNGKVSFYTETVIPTSGINKTSGQISVIDFSKNILDMSYDAKWVDVKQN